MSQCWPCSHVSRRATARGDAVGVCRECNGLGCGGHGVVDAALGWFVCYLCVAIVRVPTVMGLSYVMALDPDGTRGALWPWYEDVDAPRVTLAERRDTLVADVASGVLAELGVEAAEPAPAELAQAQREVAGLPGPLAGLDLGEIRSHRAVILASAVRGLPMGGIPAPAP